MRRRETGQYQVTAAGGDKVRAFVRLAEDGVPPMRIGFRIARKERRS